MDRKTQGGVSQSFCVAYFAAKNFVVSQSLFDDAKYDLVVDDGTRLFRVQCKTSHYHNIERQDRKHCLTYPNLNLSSVSRKDHKWRPSYKLGDFDYLWIMTSSDFYLIPIEDIFDQEHPHRTSLLLSPKWNKYIVEIPVPSGQRVVRQNPEPKSDAVKERIIELAEQGAKVSEIANQLGIPRPIVSNQIYRSGIRKGPVIKPEWKTEIIKMYKTGSTPTQIANHFGLNVKTVGSFLAYHKETVMWYQSSQLTVDVKPDSGPTQD